MWPGMFEKNPVGLGLEMMILSSWNLAVDHIVLFLFYLFVTSSMGGIDVFF